MALKSLFNWVKWRPVTFLANSAIYLGDPAAASFGKWLVGMASWMGMVVPSSDVFAPAQSAVTEQEIQKALDSVSETGLRGGWKAAQAVLTKLRDSAVPLISLPDGIAVCVLMGMEGSSTPVTVFAARQLLANVKQQYAESGAPDFLYSKALDEAIRRLIEADTKSSYFSAGCLKKLFEARTDPGFEIGAAAREKLVLMYFQSQPEYRKFLGRDEHENDVLPAGTSYREFAESMLQNAYGHKP